MNNPVAAAHRPANVPGRTTGRSAGWPVPAALIALSAIPLVAGDLAKGAGWVINLAIAEYVIRRLTRRRAIPAPAQPTRAAA